MAKIKAKQIDDLGKGLNLFTRDTMLKDNESTVAYNVWATGKNSIKKRPGIVKLCTIAGASQIDGLGTWYNGATRELIAMANGVLYKVHTGTAVALSAAPLSANVFTTKNRTDFCQAGGKLFVANGVENIRAYDGTRITDVTGSIVAKWMIYYKSCLWASGNPTAGNGSRLYRSGNSSYVGNFTNSTANPLATSIDISQSDGQDMKGFFKHQDYLYPLKERSLWRVSVGTDALGAITQELVDPARGTDSHHSIDTVDNDNFMFNEMGVFATGYEPNILDQIRTNIVSLRIDNKLKQIEKSRLDDVVGIYNDNHYYLSYTSGGGGYNDTIMVYDRQRLGWWEFQVAGKNGVLAGANCFSEYKNTSGETKLYFGSPVDGSIYYFDDTAKNDESVYDKDTVDQSQTNYSASKNLTLENAPAFTAATNTSSRWVDGTAGGSTTNDAYGWCSYISGTCAIQFDNAVSHSGTYSLKASTGAAASYIEIYQYLPTGNLSKIQTYLVKCKPSTTYRIKYWMKTNYTSGDATNGAGFNAIDTDCNGVIGNSATSTYVKTTTDWTEYTLTLNTASDAMYFRLNPRIYGHQGTGTLVMDAWWDDITVEESVNGTYETAKGGMVLGASTYSQSIAQQFVPAQAEFLGFYFRKFYDYGNFAGNVTISIVNDVSDYPADVIATTTIDNATWKDYSTTADTFISLPATLTPTSKYWIIFESSTKSDSNCTSIVADFDYSYTSGICAIGQYYANPGTTATTFDATYWKAQQFIPNIDSITTIDLMLWKTGSPTGNMTITIEGDSSDAPNGTPIATATLDVSTLATSATVYSISLPCSVTPGTKYHLVMKGQDAWTGTDNVSMGYTTAPVKNYQTYVNNGSGAWTTKVQTLAYYMRPFTNWINFYNDIYFKTIYHTPTDTQMTIITDWKGGKLSFGDYSQEKFFLQALLYFGKTPCNPTINVYIDGVLAESKTIAIGTTGTAGEGSEMIGVGKMGVGGGSLDIEDSGGGDFIQIPLNKMGRNIQFEIEEEDMTGTKTWEINAIHVQYKPLNTAYQPGTK